MVGGADESGGARAGIDEVLSPKKTETTAGRNRGLYRVAVI